jgi:3-oxoacyl-[acyl-carrier-protein] synthase III
MPFAAGDYANTVSSTLPIALQSYIGNNTFRNIMTCGFGVGLSMGAITLKRINDK